MPTNIDAVGRGPIVNDQNPSRMTLRCLALTLAVAAGCDGEPRREPASGSVTLDGRPLEGANIEFRPEGGQGLAVGSIIEGGHYRLPNPPGLAPGRHRVSITSVADAKATPDQAPDLDLARPKGKKPGSIPARYGEGSTLQAEVTAGGNSFDFELTTKPEVGPGR